MSQHFSTQDFKPRERRDAWWSMIEETCCPYIIDFGPNPLSFHGVVEAWSLGDLKLVKIAHNSAAGRRSRVEVARTDPQIYYLILQVHGRSRMAQAGDEADLGPGDLTLIDSSRPCSFTYAGDSINLNLHIPRTLIENHRPYTRPPLASALRGFAAGVTGDLMRSAFQRGDTMVPDQPQDALQDALLNLALSALFGTEPPQPCDRPLASAVQSFILDHLTDPDLAPHAIASAHSISVRHLHRLFEPAGVTVGDWIRARRLERCARDLRNTALREISLTEICYRWGFNDSAHFSRAFKAEFGLAPRNYRLASLGRPIIPERFVKTGLS